VSDLYIRGIGLPILLQPNRQTDPGNIHIKSFTYEERGRADSFLGIHK
jgi:hypothetical protein